MRKPRLAPLVLVLALTLAGAAPAQLCGDCNGDATLSILDALVAAQHAAALISLSGASFTACNVLGTLEPDPAAQVDILDALTLAQAAAGLPVSLTCAAPSVNQPPTVTIVGPTGGVWASPLTIVFDTTDADLDLLDLDFEFSTDGGASFAAASAAPGGSIGANPAFATTPASGQDFRWDSAGDAVGLGSSVPVRIRVNVFDGTDGASDEVDIAVDNRPVPPPSCPQVLPPPSTPLGCNCEQQFPPVAGVPCPIPEVGSLYYLNAVSGSDSSPGTSPGAAWRSLCHAISATPPGSTLLVAAGEYLDADIDVSTAIVVKGGHDPTFSIFDPDRFHTVVYGRLTLNHPDAVWGGFRMITDATITANVYWHNLTQGTFIRNYVEAVFRSSGGSHSVYFLVMRTPVGGVVRIRCNDVYVRNEQSGGTFRAVRFYVFSGDARLEDNRICAERLSSGGVYTIAGYGPCTATPASIVVANNILECATSGQYAVSFYGCGDSDLDLTFTGNTILSRGRGLHGYGGSSGTNLLRWRLTDNIIASTGGGSTAIDVAASGGASVELASAEGNLVFGYTDNDIHPTPLVAASNDTSGASTPASVFLAPTSGDFHLSPGGAGVGTGVNVFGDPLHGGITHDLEQRPRPMSGVWDRGALIQ